MKLQSLIIAILLIKMCISGYAIKIDNRICFSNLNNADALVTTHIYSITSDEQGFIWIGSDDGLYRYDGYELIELRDEGMLSVTALISNTKNGLWIGGGEGLRYLDMRTYQFTSFDLPGNDVIRTMYKDGLYLWIGTESGLIRFNKQTGEKNLYNSENSELSNNIVRVIFKDKKGDLWVGTSNQLNRLKKGSSIFESFDLKKNYKSEITYNHILDIQPFSENCDSLLWVGTETGLCLFNKDTGTYKSFNVENSNISNNAIKCIYSEKPGKLWLGTDFGLNLFDIETGDCKLYLHQPDKKMTLADNVIWTIYQDLAGILWFGTSNGISKVLTNNNRFKYIPVRSKKNGNETGDIVKDIVPVNNESVWIGTNNGVALYNFRKGITESLNVETKGERKLGFDKIHTLFTDDHKRLWIGSVGGISIWDEKMGKLYEITSQNRNANRLKSNYVNKFIQASDNSFWVSIWQRGFYRLSGDINQPTLLKVSLALDVNTDLIAAGKQNLWIIDQNQLLRFNTKSGTADSVKVANRLIKEKHIWSIYYSSKGILWMGSENAIFAYNPVKEKISIHEIESQQDLKILSFEEDKEGNLWMSSQKSILKFNIHKKETQIYVLGNEHGMNGFLSGCSAKTNDERILFGGNDGMVVFNPSEVVKNTYVPNLLITGLKMYNKEIRPGDKIGKQITLQQNISFLDKLEIPYNKRSFSLSFSSLDFGTPERNVYSYKLEGLDKQWHTLIGSNKVSYSGLPSKKYTFRVKGTNNDGVWLEKEAKIDIRILPPLWRRWYFIGGVYIFLIGVSIIILYFFMQKRKLARKVKAEQLEKRNIAELNRIKLQFFTNISHEFRTPLSLITGPVKKLSGNKDLNEESRLLINLVNNNVSRMLRLVNQLMDFRKISNNVAEIAKSDHDIIPLAKDTFELFIEKAKEKKLHFIFRSNCEKLNFEFDRQKIETVLFNLLSNAFKFTLEGKISFVVNLIQEENKLEIIVSDSGKGIANEDLPYLFDRFYRIDNQDQNERGAGIGLQLVKEFVELHNGIVEVQSIPRKGSRFTLLFSLSNIPFVYTSGKVCLMHVPTRKEDKNLPGENSDLPDIQSILIVEDNPEMANFIALCLQSKYRVFIEKDGVEGLKKAMELMPDLIISDVMMPKKSGTELCTELKNNIITSHIPVILLTALNATEHRRAGYTTGADAYVTKPFNEELLLARVSGILKNRELLRKKFQLEKTIEPQELPTTSPDQEFLNKIMQIIEENIHECDISANLITRELGMSHSVVYKKLKMLTGQTIVAFIRDFKLKRAAQLLGDQNCSVTDACYSVGFSDRKYFSKIFKKKFQQSPSDYKKEH